MNKKELMLAFPYASEQEHTNMVLHYDKDTLKVMAKMVWTPAMAEAIRRKLDISKVRDASLGGFKALDNLPVPQNIRRIYDELYVPQGRAPRVQRKEEIRVYDPYGSPSLHSMFR